MLPLCAGAPRKPPRDGGVPRTWHRARSRRLETVRSVSLGRRSPTPRPQSHYPPHPMPVLSSPRQEAENVTSSPLGPCSQLLEHFSSTSGCCFLGGRAESSGAGPPDKTEECAGRLEVAPVGADSLPWPRCWEGTGTGHAVPPRPEGRQELITGRTSSHLGLGQRAQPDGRRDAKGKLTWGGK